MKPDVLHVQWFGAAEADRWLFRPRSPVVFTAHDIVPGARPRRRRSGRLCSDAATASSCTPSGAARARRLRRARDRLRVIPIPHFAPRSSARTTDGRRSLGLIRPYKGTEDAVEAVLGVDGARLLVAGDPASRSRACSRWRATGPSGGSAFCPTSSGALSEATVALFPYRAEIDVSGALLQVLGAGVPRSSTTSEGSGRSSAGSARRRREPGDVDAMLALRRLLDDPDALATTARRGAERARGADLGRVRRGAPRPVPRARMMLRRGRFGDLVERQLDLFAADESGSSTRRPPPTPRGPRAPGGIRGALRRVSADRGRHRGPPVRRAARRTRRASTRTPAEEYRSAFNRAATKRFRSYAALLED